MNILHPAPSSGFPIPRRDLQRGENSCSEMNPEVRTSKPGDRNDSSEGMSDSGFQSRFKWQFFLLLMR